MWTRLRAVFRARDLDRDFDQELESHLAMLAEDYVRRGMSVEEARRAARLELGGAAQLREAHRAARGLPLVDALLQDVSYALRALRRKPGFTAIAVLTLATGIGVNTAVFTAYNAAVLRPVQAAEPERLVQITRTTRDQFFSYPDYAYYRDHSRTLAGLAAVDLATYFMAGAGAPAQAPRAGIASAVGFRFPRELAGSSESTLAAVVSENHFAVLGAGAVPGAGAAMGRTFLPEDAAPGAPPVVLVSENFWERRFARDPALLGRTLTLNGVAVTVAGITPRDFSGVLPLVPDFWVPLAIEPRLAARADILRDRNAVCCRVYARLRTGAAWGQAEAEVNALAAQLELAFPETDKRPGSQAGQLVLVRASANGPQDAGTTAFAILILGAVSLVLLIACANVASLLLARSAARQREIAIRLAIGASRGRLLRQLLTENAVMSLLAGALGVVFSWWSLHFLMLEIAASLPSYAGSFALHVAPDHRVLGYMLLLAIASTVAFGLAPALEASKPNLTSALKDEGAAFGGRLRKSRLRGLMVGTQVTVCLVLLIAAGLLVRTSERALAVDLGFEYRGIVTLWVFLPPAAEAPGKAAAIRTQLVKQLARLPEIQSVAVASRLPLQGGIRALAVAVNGGSASDRGARNSLYNVVTPGYFETVGIPIVRGRNFTAQETRDGADFDGSPVILSEATARRFWPGEDPLGKRIAFGAARNRRFAGEEYPHSAASVVIGVAKDVRSADLYRVDETCLYFPASDARAGDMVMRARGDESRAVAAVEREFQANHRELAAFVGDSRIAFSNQTGFVAARMGAIGSAIIGLLGLAMASVGIYGTVGFAVAQRTQEIGIRMALGARRGDVLGMVLRETMRPVAIGLAVGFGGSAVAARLMASFLFGLSAFDPAAFLGASGFLAAVAFVAGYLPARRATRVDPMIALRYE